MLSISKRKIGNKISFLERIRHKFPEKLQLQFTNPLLLHISTTAQRYYTFVTIENKTNYKFFKIEQ